MPAQGVHIHISLALALHLHVNCTGPKMPSSFMSLQNNAAAIQEPGSPLAEPNGITASLQTEVDRLRQVLDANNKRTSWLRHRLVTATQAKSTAVQVRQFPDLFLLE